MGVIVTQHHDSAGWTVVLFVALAVAFVMSVRWIRRDLQSNGRRCLEVMQHPAHRILTGTSMIVGGGMLRLAAALPLVPLQAARRWDLWWWWLSIAEWFTAAGALLIVGGLVVMTWPALHERFGWATLPLVVAAVAVVYALGVAATEIVLWWI